MKLNQKILLAAVLFSTSLSLFAGSVASRTTRVIGHMSVTLLSPAALTSTKAIQFTNIDLNNASLEQTEVGTIKVVGNTSEYSVTVSNNSFGFTSNNANIQLNEISTTTNSDSDGSSSINIGARISKANVGEYAMLKDASPLAVTINYN